MLLTAPPFRHQAGRLQRRAAPWAQRRLAHSGTLSRKGSTVKQPQRSQRRSGAVRSPFGARSKPANYCDWALRTSATIAGSTVCRSPMTA